jgi:hypothetical protein
MQLVLTPLQPLRDGFHSQRTRELHFSASSLSQAESHCNRACFSHDLISTRAAPLALARRFVIVQMRELLHFIFSGFATMELEEWDRRCGLGKTPGAKTIWFRKIIFTNPQRP